MVLFGIKFLNYPFDCDKYRYEILFNSEKPVAKVLFNVKAYCIESDILLIHKEFVASSVMNYLYMFLFVISLIPFLIWSVATPLMIVSVLSFLWGLFNTPWFNYLMFRIMIRKLGYKGKTRLL